MINDEVKFHCPRCGLLLIRVNDIVKNGQRIDCAYMCINQSCREKNMEFPIYYGYTQEDINNNISKKKQVSRHVGGEIQRGYLDQEGGEYYE